MAAGFARQLQELLGVRHQAAQELIPLSLVRPVQLPLALDTAAEVATQTPLLRPALWLLPILLGQLPAQFPDAVGEQVVGVLDRSLPENRSGVQRQLQLPLRLQIAPLARQLEAALEGQPHLLVQDQLGPE